MAGLDLTGVRATVDAWIVDTLKVERDYGNADDVLNEETGILTPAARTNIYQDRGAVQPIGQGELSDPDVARYYEIEGARYRALLPMATTDDVQFRKGDLLTMLTVDSDSGDVRLVGREFQVLDPPAAGSFAVLRILYLRPV